MPDEARANLHEIRTDYSHDALHEADAAADPIQQFARWFAEAAQAKVPEVNAMTLATASADGVPSARIVLLKEFSEAGFTFFTNYDSHKGQDLAANPRAALVFFWQPQERQVRIEGTVQRVSREVSKTYFDSRPRASRVAASLSRQSEVVPSRKVLEDEFAKLDKQFGDTVPLPDWWGGYCLSPTAVEFWQGRRSRLHDRLRYRLEGLAWRLERLSP